VTIPQVACPECGAKLSSKAGFTAGQRIKCPKCQEAFAVPGAKRKPVAVDDEPMPVKKKKKPVAVDDDDDEEDERPKKIKKKGKKGAKERDYASSPLRFVVLGVLVVVMLVMAYFLYRKFTAPPLPDIIIPARNEGE